MLLYPRSPDVNGDLTVNAYQQKPRGTVVEMKLYVGLNNHYTCRVMNPIQDGSSQTLGGEAATFHHNFPRDSRQNGPRCHFHVKCRFLFMI